MNTDCFSVLRQGSRRVVLTNLVKGYLRNDWSSTGQGKAARGSVSRGLYRPANELSGHKSNSATCCYGMSATMTLLPDLSSCEYRTHCESAETDTPYSRFPPKPSSNGITKRIRLLENW